MAKKTTSRRKSTAKAQRRSTGRSNTSNKTSRTVGKRQPSSGSERSTLDPRRSRVLSSPEETGARPPRAQGRLSGDLQNLSDQELDDSESAQELAEEGQDFEGALVKGVEDVPDEAGIPRHNPPPDGAKIPQYKNRNRI